MSLTVLPLHPNFAAEIIGTEHSKEPDEELVRTVDDAMATYAVSVVRDVSDADDDHIRFSRAFGPLELPPKMGRFNAAGRMRGEQLGASGQGTHGGVLPNS